MRKKIILIIIVSIIITFGIYQLLKSEKIRVIALGDSIANGTTPYGAKGPSYNDYLNDYLKGKNRIKNYYNEFLGTDLRVHDLIHMIEENIERTHNKKDITIQQALVKSDIVTLSIGSYDLYNKLGITNTMASPKNNEELNKYFISMFTDLNDLIKLIRKYTAGQIVIIGFYNPVTVYNPEMEQIFEYLNKSYKGIAEKNNCYYIEINKEIGSNMEYIPNSSNIHINHKAHELISEKIKDTLKI